MEDATLKSLLQQADPPGPLPTPPSTLIPAILHRRTRQRRTAHFTTLLAALLLVATTLAILTHRHPQPQIARTPVLPPPTRADIDRLTAEAAAWTALANRLDASDRLARATQSAAWSQTAISLERERAAAILLTQGDWQRAHHQPGSEENYRRATQLFPGTHSATQARARLVSPNKKDQA